MYSWRVPSVNEVRLWEYLSLGRLERSVRKRHGLWCGRRTWKMPVRGSSTRPTLALTLANSVEKCPEFSGGVRRGEEDLKSQCHGCAVWWWKCGFEGGASMELQMSTVRCCLPSAYPKPHWIIYMADRVWQQAEEQSIAFGDRHELHCIVRAASYGVPV